MNCIRQPPGVHRDAKTKHVHTFHQNAASEEAPPRQCRDAARQGAVPHAAPYALENFRRRVLIHQHHVVRSQQTGRQTIRIKPPASKHPHQTIRILHAQFLGHWRTLDAAGWAAMRATALDAVLAGMPRTLYDDGLLLVRPGSNSLTPPRGKTLWDGSCQNPVHKCVAIDAHAVLMSIGMPRTLYDGAPSMQPTRQICFRKYYWAIDC